MNIRSIIVFILLLSIVGCATPKAPTYSKYIQRNAVLNSNATVCLTYAGPISVQYSGLVNYDGLKKDGDAMLYYAPTAGVFLASVVAHSISVEASKRSEKVRIQKEADKVLDPYNTFIGNVDYRRLMNSALETYNIFDLTIKNIENTEDIAEDQWVLENKPVFYMLQDESAFILKNSVTF